MLNFKSIIQDSSGGKAWIVPFIFVVVFIILLSSRLLSDPDLGFHLNSGRYIVENFSFPEKDVFTYTSADNDYIDLQWLFQVIIFLSYKIMGYAGLSVMVTLFSLILLFLLVKRNQSLGISLGITSYLLFAGYLMIESRLVLRPELFTFILMTFLLWVLDNYYYKQKKNLYILPLIMIIWCNVHSLFILGIFVLGAYMVSQWVRDKKIDWYYLLWFGISVLICFVNPYFYKSFTFPIELFTRFDDSNIFNQHIKEFQSLFESDWSVLKNGMTLLFMGITALLFLLTFRKRNIHEFILMIGFSYLALISIRNIPLFVLVAIPIAGQSLYLLKEKNTRLNKLNPIFKYGLILLVVVLISRVFTNAHYINSKSPYKTGFGLDEQQQPVNAANFITLQKMEGKILNSLGAGGWLSWSTQQPVFIDGRLEVIKENVYREVVESWKDKGLEVLLSKHKPSVIFYNYSKYFSWTKQLSEIPDWKLSYLDESIAIFTHRKTEPRTKVYNVSELLTIYHVRANISVSEKIEILNQPAESDFRQWLNGFYQKTDYEAIALLNIAYFCMQVNRIDIAENFFLEYYKNTRGNNYYVLYALAEIYKSKGDAELLNLCYANILKNEPDNVEIIQAITELKKAPVIPSDSIPLDQKEKDAIALYNRGNSKYQNRDYTGAIKDYDQAISLKPDYFKAYNNRGIVKAAALGLNDEALMDFEKAIEINPDYGDAYLGRGSVKLSLNDIPGACDDWQKALKLGSTQAKFQIDKFCNNK